MLMRKKDVLSMILKIWDKSCSQYECNYSPAFKTYYILKGDYPGISLCLPKKNKISSNDIALLEKGYSGRPNPYFSVPVMAGYSNLHKLALAEGYKVSETITFNVWDKIHKTPIPKELTYKFGNFLDPELFTEFTRLVRKVFQMKDDNIAQFNRKFITKSKKYVGTLLLYKKNKLIGLGSYLVIGDVGWLFAGCIESGYRKRGYWKTLLYLRQLLTKEAGAKKWFITTSNPILTGKSDYHLDFKTYMK